GFRLRLGVRYGRPGGDQICRRVRNLVGRHIVPRTHRVTPRPLRRWIGGYLAPGQCHIGSLVCHIGRSVREGRRGRGLRLRAIRWWTLGRRDIRRCGFWRRFRRGGAGRGLAEELIHGTRARHRVLVVRCGALWSVLLEHLPRIEGGRSHVLLRGCGEVGGDGEQLGIQRIHGKRAAREVECYGALPFIASQEGELVEG